MLLGGNDARHCSERTHHTPSSDLPDVLSGVKEAGSWPLGSQRKALDTICQRRRCFLRIRDRREVVQGAAAK